MKSLSPLRLGGTIGLLIALMATPVLAHSPADSQSEEDEVQADTFDEDRAFRQMVQAIDVLPNREVMEQRWPDASQRLIALANDSRATVYERWRATSLLGNFAEPEVRRALLELSTDAEERVRAMAFYVLGTVFLEASDDELFAHLQSGLDDETQRVRTNVVRSLGWTDHEGAHRLLEKIASEDDDDHLRKAAQRALQRLE